MHSNNLSASTNTALKSELLKAKFSFDLQRASKTPVNLQKQSNFQVKSRAPKRYEEQNATGSTSWEACHASLLSKSKYYEECVENSCFDDRSENMLIDFSNKNHVIANEALHLPSATGWVECVDEFGRTRVVRRGHEPSRCSVDNRSFFEVRDKSVGFLQLSTNDAYKQQQLEALRKLHHSTLEARAMNSLIKEQKKLKIERRLALASKRRALFIFGD